jgi:hypothetical protein
MSKRYELTESQWLRIEAILPGKVGDRGRTAQDNRLFVNAVLWACGAVLFGVICRSATVTGKPSTNALLAEPRLGSGKNYLRY